MTLRKILLIGISSTNLQFIINPSLASLAVWLFSLTRQSEFDIKSLNWTRGGECSWLLSLSKMVNPSKEH